jgi:capsular exopolysaccharide synthesis family protein
MHAGSLPPVASEDSASAAAFRDYLRVLRSRRYIVLFAVLIITGSAIAVSVVQTPVYSASAQVLLKPANADTVFNPATGQVTDPTRAIETEVQLLEGQPIRDAVRAELGHAPPVKSSVIGQTNVIRVTVDDTDAKAAAALANSYARHYVDYRRNQVVDAMLAAGQQVQTKIADLQTQIDALGAKLNAAAPADRANLEAIVGPQRNALVQQQSTFQSRLDELSVEAALSTGDALLATPATIPKAPVSPKPLRNGALGLCVGLVFGVGMAFLFDWLDDSVKSPHDLARVIGHLPALGVIPAEAMKKDKEEGRLVTEVAPASASAEAYRSLRTSIRLLRLDRPLVVLQVTSPRAAEGKTTTVANLGVTMAQVGLRTVIVCCDLRRPRIHELFNLPSTIGFTSVLLGDIPLSEAVQPVPGHDNLFLLASGPSSANPAELLSGAGVGETFDALRARFDLVLVDCPPVLPVTDAAVLSTRVDGTLLVTLAGLTTARSVRHTLEVLNQISAPVMGVLLNGAGGESGYGAGYGYGYGYNYEPEPEPESVPVPEHAAPARTSAPPPVSVNGRRGAVPKQNR